MTATRAIAARRPVPRRGLSREEAAMYIGVSPTKFDQMREDGRVGPPRIADGRKLWDIRDLDEAFDSLPFEETDDREEWRAEA